ncbi:MAG: Crp/Fnr family transcriptional regulator [Halanaerobiaceae bacterium]
MGKINCLKRLAIFEELSEKELENVSIFFHTEDLNTGDFLFHENQPIESIHIVKSGRLKLSKLSVEGKELTLGFATQNTVFGEESLFSKERYSMNVEAVEPSCIIMCSKEDMEKLFMQKPNIAIKVIRSLSQKLSQSKEQLSDLAFHNVRERLVSTLKRLASNYGYETDDSFHVNFKLTHDELANIINASRVTVTQTLSKLKKEGLVEINEDEIILRNG